MASKFKTLIIGCGSIGTRRAAILAELGHDVRCLDVSPDAQQKWGLAPAEGWADVALICTPPDMRLPVITSVVASHNLKGIFVEKPLALSEDEAMAIIDITERVPVTMGACNMRFDSRLEDFVATDTVFARMGQHSDYWSETHQPITMILDSIHELDLLRHFCGPITKITGVSDLDRAQAVTSHESGIRGALDIDRLTDPPVRSLAIDHRMIPLWPPDPEMYRREMEHFMDAVECLEPTCNPLSGAAHILTRALEITGES